MWHHYDHIYVTTLEADDWLSSYHLGHSAGYVTMDREFLSSGFKICEFY